MITDTQKGLLLLQYYDRGILKKEIRSYEVSLWTLLDEFITVLKWSDVEQKGRIELPKMTLNIDGTLKLTFSIPMYYRLNGKLVENPNWYNTLNGNLIMGLRKLKVIFNKSTEFEEVFELVITKVDENHEKDISTCEIESEGLAFLELGKIGYKISLSLKNFELIYEEWSKGDKTDPEPIQNLDYWCLKAGLEKYDPTATINPRKWYYDVRMNWNSFDNTDTENLRASDKVYEEPYTSSWANDLTPAATEKYKEKARAVEVEKSNLYNITQSIAEKFEIFCRYQYLYDENYHIIGRLIIFYNNFMQENPSEIIGFQYPYSLSKVERTMDSANVTTKMFILGTDDIMDITNAPVNDMREDYLLNFDYMYQTKAISKELYDAIKPYKVLMRNFNNLIFALLDKVNSYLILIPEIEGKQTVALNSIELDKELIAYNNAYTQALSAKDTDGDDPYIDLTAANADYFVLLTNEGGSKYINLTNTNKGIVEDSIKVFLTFHSSDEGALLDNPITNYTILHDDYNNVSGIVFNDAAQFNVSTDINWIKIFEKYYRPEGYSGNVWLSHRLIVSASKITTAGYSFSGTYSTLYPLVYTAENSGTSLANDGEFYDILYTPITAKGAVKTLSEINTYLNRVVVSGQTPQEWMASDKKDEGLFLGYFKLTDRTVHTEANNYASTLNTLQADWDYIRSEHGWFGYNSNPDKITIPTCSARYTQEQLNEYSTSLSTAITRVYLTYKYDPHLYYQKIVDSWVEKLNQDESDYATYTKQLGPTSATDSKYDMSVYTDGTTLAQAYEYGLNKLLNDALDELDTKIEEKEAAIKAFLHLMGPALREGYWQPENYNDYGDRHEYTGAITNSDITADAGSNAIIAWDSKLFDDEDKLYYESGINKVKTYYPCIDLLAVFSNSIPTDLEKYSVVWKATNITGYTYDWTSAKDIKVLSINSKALIRFVNISGIVKPVLVMIGAKSFTDDELTRLTSTGEARLEKYSTTVDSSGNVTITHSNIVSIGNNWILTADGTDENFAPQLVFPRIKFSSLALKTDSSNLKIHYNSLLLEMFEDYRINTRNTERNSLYYPEYYITIKPEILIKYTLNLSFDINYVFSNSNTEIYLDAIVVHKENAYPKVEYSVSVNALNVLLLLSLYALLARIVMINDTDLKFENVFGYISLLELDLDNCANDTIEVKNYKTKFEDLFSTIVAQTEALKRSGTGLTTALSGGIPLSEEGFTETIENNLDIFQAYLDSHFDSSEVVKDRLSELFTEASEILGDSNKALNEMSALTEKNASILAGFAQNVSELLSVKVFRLASRPDKFESGDIWIQVDNNDNVIARYIAITSSSNLQGESNSSTRGFARTYDGSLASISGASLNIDAVAGTVDVEALNHINIKSGNNIYIAADEKVDIVGNKEVNIGGTTINIAAGSTTGTVGSIGGVNIVATHYNTNNIANAKVAKVLIHPTEITMAGAKINMYTGTAAGATSAIKIDGTVSTLNSTPGIWIGSSKSVELYSGTGASTGSSVSIKPERIIIGTVSDSSKAVFELKPSYILMGVGTTSSDFSSSDITVNAANSITGMKLTRNSFGLSIGSGTTRSVILANSDGITVGTGSTPVTSGSYVTISGSGVNIGSLGNLYVNMNNFKLQTDSTYGTRFAVGKGLLYITSNGLANGEIANSAPALGSDLAPWVGMVFTNNNLYILGTVYANDGVFNGTVYAGAGSFTGTVTASSFTATCTNGILKATGTALGFYDTSNNAIMTLTGTTMTVASGYTLSIGGNLNIDSNNLTINSNPTTGENYFYVGDSGSSPSKYIKYTLSGTLEVKGSITATSFILDSNATVSGLSYNDLEDTPTIPSSFSIDGISSDFTWNGTTYKVAITSTSDLLIGANGNGSYSGGVVIAKDGSSKAVEINSSHINFDYSSSNYIHMDSNGIDVHGNRISINGDPVWARDDIIVLKRLGTTGYESLETIENRMSTNGIHDWVLIKPYYDALIVYTYLNFDNATSADWGTNIVYMWTGGDATITLITNNSLLAFGNGASWYQYELTFDVNIALSDSVNFSFTIELRNSDNNTITFFNMEDRQHVGASTSGSNVAHVTCNSRTDMAGLYDNVNMCTEGAQLQLVIHLTTGVNSSLTDITLTASCDATTARVPCTVYYYP